ncbi:MAG: LptF/LptG family permease [Candidatus Omnitrophica bacterium]|nr:LptF/LptG family permease [Candidatus Omnitrophota bacterium]
MRILQKSVFWEYFTAFIFSAMLLIVLGIIGDVLGFLDDIFKNNIPLASVFSFYLNFLPFAFVNMVPFACLLAGVFVFSNLSKNHEVVAIITNGISIWSVVRPIMFLTFIICLVTFIVNEKVVPSTLDKAEQIKHQELESVKYKASKTVIRNFSIYGEGDLLIFAKKYYPYENKLEDVIIYKQNEQQVVTSKINARISEWNRKGHFWMAFDCLVFNLDENGKFVGEPQTLKTMKLPVKETPLEFLRGKHDPKLMNYADLKRYIMLLSKNSPSSATRLIVDLNYKIAFPFTALVTVMMGIPFCISVGRVNTLVGMAKGIVCAFTYVPVMAVCLALGKSGVLNPYLASWLAMAVFGLAGIILISRVS